MIIGRETFLFIPYPSFTDPRTLGGGLSEMNEGVVNGSCSVELIKVKANSISGQVA